MLSCDCVVRSARISLSRQDEIFVWWQDWKNHASKCLGCNDLSHISNFHEFLNTNRAWMERRECAAQQQGDKKSILMNIPTQQCLRKRKRDKTEPSFQGHRVSVRRRRIGSTAEDTKQRWNFIVPSWIAASCLCTRMQVTNNSLPLFADISLQLIPTDVNSSISLASSQNSSDFKTRSSFPSAPHPVADIASAPHFIDIVPLVTWLICRERTAVLDPKRVLMQALDDCTQYFQVWAPSDYCVRWYELVQLFSFIVPMFLYLLSLQECP